jgi:uncharacterized protein YndB with AHSA1/START domain
MSEIRHRVGISGSGGDNKQLLTTDAGLSKWWTTDTRGAGDIGSTIEFRFGGGGPDFEVIELIPGQVVRWRHSGEMPEDWIGSEILFELREEGKQTVVNFSHYKWEQSGEFLAHCSTKWAIFLMSLKSCIESGKGQPYPEDLHIDFDD